MFVKICGITSEEDALLATALGADAVGFVFAPSRRQMSVDAVRDILRRLPREIVTVGVFRNERPERVVEVVTRLGLHGAQLHGHEPVREVRWVRERIPFVIQAFAAGNRAIADAGRGPADVLLLDAADPGSGRVFDWALAADVPSGARLLLAGGLTPDNVEDAIRRVRPWGVDVSTGVEREPGHKDATKVRRFVAAARAAGDEVADLAGRPEHAAGEEPYDWEVDELRE